MAKLKLSDTHGDYEALIDTGIMNVEIRETYIGTRFVSNGGEELGVAMRDNGYELMYRTLDGVRTLSLNGGEIVHD